MIALVLMIFVLGLIGFLIIYSVVTAKKPLCAEPLTEVASPKGYKLHVVKEGSPKAGLPYYVPDDGKSDVRIPHDQFVMHFPEERANLTKDLP